MAVEVAQRQAAELLVDVPAQPVDGALGDARHHVGLQPGEERAEDVEARQRAAALRRAAPKSMPAPGVRFMAESMSASWSWPCARSAGDGLLLGHAGRASAAQTRPRRSCSSRCPASWARGSRTTLTTARSRTRRAGPLRAQLPSSRRNEARKFFDFAGGIIMPIMRRRAAARATGRPTGAASGPPRRGRAAAAGPVGRSCGLRFGQLGYTISR